MKYIISESKIDSLIKEYLLKNSDILEVDFNTIRVHLGSGPNKKGETSVIQKQIIIYINNVKNTKGYRELKEIKTSVKNALEGLFNLDFDEYGSEWSLVVYQVKREII
jgi:predicted RNase H-related nuclease YkuK (DUF458 family)